MSWMVFPPLCIISCSSTLSYHYNVGNCMAHLAHHCVFFNVLPSSQHFWTSHRNLGNWMVYQRCVLFHVFPAIFILPGNITSNNPFFYLAFETLLVTDFSQFIWQHIPQFCGCIGKTNAVLIWLCNYVKVTLFFTSHLISIVFSGFNFFLNLRWWIFP